MTAPPRRLTLGMVGAPLLAAACQVPRAPPASPAHAESLPAPAASPALPSAHPRPRPAADDDDLARPRPVDPCSFDTRSCPCGALSAATFPSAAAGSRLARAAVEAWDAAEPLLGPTRVAIHPGACAQCPPTEELVRGRVAGVACRDAVALGAAPLGAVECRIDLEGIDERAVLAGLAKANKANACGPDSRWECVSVEFHRVCGRGAGVAVWAEVTRLGRPDGL